MKTLPYIEDYIELMASHILSWPVREPLIKLARYDEPIVSSMNDQIQRQIGFSDKQAALAQKIVVKYKRQWALVGYDVSAQEDNPKFKLATRVIDRRSIIDIVNGSIEIRFPYNQEMISHIRAAVNTVPGHLVFDKSKRCWLAGLVEPRLIWAKEFGNKYNFAFGETFDQAIGEMLSQKDYSICLLPDDDHFTISNAANSLVDYIEQQGGFHSGNLLKLIDLSGVCGYQVDDSVYKHVEQDINVDVVSLLTSRETNLEYETNLDLTSVIKYATLAQRWPMYVYESGSSKMRTQLAKHFTESEIIDKKSLPETNNDSMIGKVIYINNWKYASSKIPLLVTTHTLMIGSRRQQMLQCAEKVVYYSQKVPQND